MPVDVLEGSNNQGVKIFTFEHIFGLINDITKLVSQLNLKGAYLSNIAPMLFVQHILIGDLLIGTIKV